MELTLNCKKQLPQHVVYELDLAEDVWDDNDIDYCIEIPTESPNVFTDDEVAEIKEFMREWNKKYGEYGSFSTGEAWFDQELLMMNLVKNGQ